MKNQVNASNIIKKSHPKSTIELLIPDSMRYNDIVLRNINHLFVKKQWCATFLLLKSRGMKNETVL